MSIKIKKQSALMMIMVIGMCLYYALKNSFIYLEIFKLLLLIANLCGIVLIIGNHKKVSRTKLLLFVILTAISIYYFILLNNYSVLTMIISMLVFMENDIDYAFDIMFWANLVFDAGIALLHLRAWDNTLGMQVGILLLLYLCKKRGKLKLLHYVVVLLIAVVFSTFTGNKTVTVVLFLVLPINFISRYNWGQSILKSWVIKLIFPICCVLNYFFAECVGNLSVPIIGNIISPTWNNHVVAFAKVLDYLMSSRLILTYQSLQYFGFSLFGGNIDVESLNLDEHSYFYLDSGYAHILQGWGLIFLLLLLIVMTLIMCYFIKIERYDLVTIGIAIALWAVNEPILNIVCWNFAILYGGRAIYYFFPRRKVIRHDSRKYSKKPISFNNYPYI